MTAIPSIDTFATARTGRMAEDVPSFAVDETHWGYVVRHTEAEPVQVQIAQGIAWFAGIGFAVATLGLWLTPMTVMQGDVLSMKLGATFVLAGIAAYLLWYASRGIGSELQIDTALGEVREVVRNQAGRPSLIGRYGFDAIGGVHIDRTVLHHGEPCLVLRQGNSPQVIPVAWGPEPQLTALRDRMGRDLMIRPLTPLRQPLPVGLPDRQLA